MRERVCKNCGGREYKVEGQNMVRCKFCGTLYVDEESSTEEEVLLVGAKDLARQMRFDEAISELDKILSLYPLSYEALFTRALAKHKIVLYPSSRKGFKRPRFFDEISSIAEDADAVKALELAPEERQSVFQSYIKRIDKIKKLYEDVSSKQNGDVLVCVAGTEEEKFSSIMASLQKEGLKVLQIPVRDKEEESFDAIKKCKVFLLFVYDSSKLAEFKDVLDRWSYFTSLKQKPVSGFVVALADGQTAPTSCKNVLQMTSATFLQDVVVSVKNGIENFTEVAKIDTVSVERATPEKKEYANVETVKPVELGKYQVENLNLTDEAKQKWVFLSLKNGDFQTARQSIDEELEKDPYNSEMLFASLMEEKKIKTREDFFSSLSNFGDREKLDNILRYANREFATNFVDDWEKLVEKMNLEEYYLTYLTYLAGYKTPNREEFISSAEQLAVESGNEKLIEKVETCFDKSDVDRFVSFYYALAQRHDEKKWFDKVLELDEGHYQSNLTILMTHFKTTQEKLTYRNRDEVENVFKFLEEKDRTQVVSSVVDMVLPVAFCNLKEAEEQLDFYLSYAPDEALPDLAKKIAEYFLQNKFFTSAEKYIAVALSKEKTSELYWLLIQAKLHCRTETDLILSTEKISSMAEWSTLLTLSDDASKEYYASVVSKANMYGGKKTPPQAEVLDKVALKSKMQDFLLRNNQILIDAQKENLPGVNYFIAQFQPFEKHMADMENVETLDEYLSIYSKIFERLEALDLTLDASVNVTHMQNREKGFEEIKKQEIKQEEQRGKQIKDLKRDKFLKRYITIFLEYFPLGFCFLLLLVCCIKPKSVLLYFSQEFLIGTMIFSLFIAFLNFLFWYLRKKKMTKSGQANFLSLFCIGIANIVLFVVSFYITPVGIEIASASELQTLLSNAKYATFTITQDIELEDDWKSTSFYGSLDGNGHTISNISLSSGGFFTKNSGEVSNLQLEFSDVSLSDVSTFGLVAQTNSGSIENCIVVGTITLTELQESAVGGLVGKNSGSVCNCRVQISLTVSGENVTVGGLVGSTSKSSSKIFQNKVVGSVNVSATSSAEVGGLVGNLGKLNENFSQNGCDCTISVSSQTANVGGLLGSGQTSISNCYSKGEISVSASSGFVGGLCGVFNNTSGTITTSYSAIQFSSNISTASLVGSLTGRVDYSYSASNISNLTVEVLQVFSGVSDNCANISEGHYFATCNFDTTIWTLPEEDYPYLCWEI